MSKTNSSHQQLVVLCLISSLCTFSTVLDSSLSLSFNSYSQMSEVRPGFTYYTSVISPLSRLFPMNFKFSSSQKPASPRLDTSASTDAYVLNKIAVSVQEHKRRNKILSRAKQMFHILLILQRIVQKQILAYGTLDSTALSTNIGNV